MDPVTLADIATSLLTPYLKKAGEKELDKLAEQMPEAVGKLWNGIWNQIKERPAAAEAASDLAANPDDEDNEIYFKKQLQRALERDQGFNSLLTDLIKGAKAEIPSDLKIFISYRRADSKYVVDQIRDRLIDVYGEQAIFPDLESIPPGKNFSDALNDAMSTCNIMLVVIGPQWTSLTDDQGNKRLFDPHDYTRREVEAGLANRNVLIIPLLVMNANIPQLDEIPESLADLRFRNMISIRNDPDFNSDVKQLIQGINESFEAPSQISGSFVPENFMDLVRAGPDAWNNWRRSNPAIIPECNHHNFSNSTFQRCNFGKTSFRHVNFKKTVFYSDDFTETVFEHCDFESCTFDTPHMSGARFIDCHFDTITFKGCNLQRSEWWGISGGNVKFSACDMADSTLEETSFDGKGVKFDGCYLRSVRFDHVTLQRVIFRNTDLQRMRFTNLTIENADFKDASLKDTEFYSSNLSSVDLSLLVFSRAKFVDTTLTHASLSEANLYGVTMENVILSFSSMEGADLHGAIFTGCNLTSTVLTKADMHDVKITGSDLSNAVALEADLSRGQLVGVTMNNAFFERTNMQDVNLSQSDISRSRFIVCFMQRANLEGAVMDHANLWGSDLSYSNLRAAKLLHSDLTQVSLNEANLTDANLTETDLSRSILIDTIVENTIFSKCKIYGISVWNLIGTPKNQKDLIITPDSYNQITTDEIEISQFVFLLLNNAKLRKVIDNVTSKTVLILGRFTPERKAVLDALREELRRRNYVPILFDFEAPSNRDLTETIVTLAHLSRFIIADLTDGKSIPQELKAIVPDLPSVAVQPLIIRNQREYAMYEHIKRYPWVLPLYEYDNQKELLENIVDGIIVPSEAKVKEINKQTQ